MEFIFKVRCLVHRYKEIHYNSIYIVATIDNLNKKISLIGLSGYFKQQYFSPLEHKDYNNYSGRYRFNYFNEEYLKKYHTALALVDNDNNIKAGMLYEAKPIYYHNTVNDRKIDIFINGVYYEMTSSSFRVLNEYESKTYSRKSKIEHLFKEEIKKDDDFFFRIPK
jgi:outer membrane receptor for ferric coprogen and ferric-rhodotorulic acid